MAEIALKAAQFVFSKGRDKAAERLGKGDVVAQDLRKLIVNDIKDIRSKLVLMARKDLATSIDIFEEECENLFHLLNRTNREDENYSAEKALESSISFFKEARAKATAAFNDEALDTSDRILATRYRILATLLATFDKPANAFKPCSRSLKKLHDLPTIQKTFKTQLSGGLKAWIGKKRRIDIISSVCEVNRLVYDIMQIAVSDEDSQIFSLPGVPIGKEEVDPLRDLRVVEILRKNRMEDISVTWSFGQEGDGKLKFPQSIATDALGRFIVADGGDCKIKVFDHKGNHLYYFLGAPADACEEHETLDLDTDRVGNIYLLVIENGIYNVKMFDKNGNGQIDFPLIKTSKGRALAVDSETRNVFILEGYVKEKCNALVDVYNKDGHFVRRFGKGDLECALDITAPSDGRVFVLDSSLKGRSKWISVFDERGKHLKTFSVVPYAVALSFNPADANVVVASVQFHLQSVKLRAKVSLYSVSGDHLRIIDLDAKGVILMESIAVTEEGCIAVALIEDFSGSLESKIIVF